MEKRSPVLNFSRSDLKWQITDLSQYEWIMKWTVPEGLPFFKGHFPKGAILPSVISLEASLELIGLVLNKEDILLKEVKTAKFFAGQRLDTKLDLFAFIFRKVRLIF